MSGKMLRWKPDEETASFDELINKASDSSSELCAIWLTVPQLRSRLGLPTDDSTRRQISRWADDLDDCDRKGSGRERRVRLSAMCERLQRTKFGDAVAGIEDECVTLFQPAVSQAPICNEVQPYPQPREHSPRYEPVSSEVLKPMNPLVQESKAPYSTTNDELEASPQIGALSSSAVNFVAKMILDSGVDSGWGEDVDSGSKPEGTTDWKNAVSPSEPVRGGYIAVNSKPSATMEHVSRDGSRTPVHLCQERKPLSSMTDREFAEYCRYLQVKTGRINEDALPKMPEEDAPIRGVAQRVDSSSDIGSATKLTRTYRNAVVNSIPAGKRDGTLLNRVSNSVGKWIDRRLKPVLAPKPVPASPVYGAFALTARPNRLVKG